MMREPEVLLTPAGQISLNQPLIAFFENNGFDHMLTEAWEGDAPGARGFTTIRFQIKPMLGIEIGRFGLSEPAEIEREGKWAGSD